MNKKVWEICTQHDISAGAPNRSLESAFLIMNNKGFRRLPITKIGKIHGILTVSDLMRAIYEVGLPEAYKLKISNRMSSDPACIHRDKSVIEASKIMRSEKYSSLIVVGDAPDRIIGMITERDIMRSAEKILNADMLLSGLDKDLLTSGLEKVDIDTEVKLAIKIMLDTKMNRVIVTENDKAIGIVTGNDVLRLAVDEIEEFTSNPNFIGSITLKFLVKRKLYSANYDWSLLKALNFMKENRIGGLPIVNENGEVDGIFTEKTAVEIISKLPED